MGDAPQLSTCRQRMSLDYMGQHLLLVKIISDDTQLICCHIQGRNNNIECLLTFIYEFNTSEEMNSSMGCTRTISPRINKPWLLSGSYAQLTTKSNNLKSKVPFRFFNVQVKHLSFMDIVQKSWKVNKTTNKMKNIQENLKALKEPLKKLNKIDFLSITLKVESKSGIECCPPRIEQMGRHHLGF